MLTRVAHDAGLPHITPHQLRHTYATALVNAGVSLQSADGAARPRLGRDEPALRTAVRLHRQGRVRAGAHRGEGPPRVAAHPATHRPHHRCRSSTATGNRRPAIKARLAGGFCIRAQVQGPCAYANICEHCPNFRTDTGYLPVLAAQRADAETLARDAEARGWGSEAERHRRLIERLDAHIHASPDRMSSDPMSTDDRRERVEDACAALLPPDNR